VREAVIWSLFVGYVYLPDDDFDRLLLITLPFLLILELSLRRWVVVWVVSLFATVGGIVGAARRSCTACSGRMRRPSATCSG
jgi:hypothetical protein